MKLKNVLFFLLLIPMLLLGGCSDSSQLHQKIIVQGIGIDKEDELYKITIQAFDYQNTDSEKGPNVKVLTLSGESVMSALNTISKRTGLEPLYSQNMIIIIGENTAKNGVNKVIDFFIRHYESRPNVKICVAKGTAAEILNCKAEESVIQAKDISDLVDDKSDIVHFIGALHDVSTEPSTTALSIIEGESKIIVESGIAVFRGDSLVGMCDDDRALGIKLIKGRGKGEDYFLELDDGRKVTCVINDCKSNIKPYVSDVPEFTVKLGVDVGVFEIDRINEGDIYNTQDLIKEKLRISINNLLKNTIDKVIMDYGSDIFHFGKILMNKNPNYFREIGDWGRKIKECKFNINTNIDISVTGTEAMH